jgi:integrase/recombinase XerC/integrase/recombinase XerD
MAAPAASQQGQETFVRLIDDYLQEKRADGASPRTVAHYKAVLEEVLLPFCREADVESPSELTNRHLNDLGAGHLDGTLSRSKRPISKATVHSYMRAINSFLTWARAQGAASAARGRLPSMRKRVLDTLTRDEIQAMEDAATSERDKLIVRLLADSGLRLGELLALRAGNIRAEGGKHVLKIPGRERAGGRSSAWVGGKGDRERLVPVSPTLARRLRRYAERGRPDATSDRLFLTLRRGRASGQLDALTESAAEQMIRNLAETAGVKKRVYPHLLRHSFATEYLRRGGNPILLQQILGHSSLAMITQTYQHLTLVDAHDELMRLLAADQRS